MKLIRLLTRRNLQRRPVRSLALILISALMAISVFGGSVVVASLRNGLKSYRDRLGADIVVVPYAARTKGTFENVLLQGIPGNFYMDYSLYEKIAGMEGVEIAAPQFFLATATTSCCSVSVQVIGFDPEKDFTVQPWISKVYDKSLKTGDIIVGSKLTVPKNKTLTFYGVDCRIVSVLEETGTGLDTAVYTNMDTIARMVESAGELGFTYFKYIEPGKTVSSVMVKVAEGYDIEEVTGDINIHVGKVVASQAGTMISGIAGGLSGVSNIIGILIGAVWVLAIVILAIVFAMIAHERAKEFAVMRAMGASGGMVSALLLTEALLLGLIGSAAGLFISALLVFPFSGSISAALGLPFLLPKAAKLILFGLLALILPVAGGAAVSAVMGSVISKRETGMQLRGE